MNEILFFGSIFFVSLSNIIACYYGKEALTALMCIQAVLANFFVSKQITLFGVIATATDALSVGTMLSLNLLQEYYEKPAAKKAIWISFFCALFTMICTLFHLAYLPAPTDTFSDAFNLLFMPIARIVVASLSVYLFVQLCETALYGYLKMIFHKKYFILRNYLSTSFTQLLDTILFTFLGLYGLNGFNNLHTLFTIIAVSYTIKMIVIGTAVPLIRLFRKIYPSVVSA